ncbi:MAG TPA: choice-of-anchor D domain-containing protein [Thermoanaerobaculia bacterium]|nr:choice-of-anchor D domain-containing protein [Thermoanaerobaculia bacterium]
MPVIDIYFDSDEERRKRRRGKWLLPLLVGLGAALAFGREKPPAPTPPRPAIVVPPPVVVQPRAAVIAAPPVVTPTPPRMAIAPARLDFGDGPLTRGIPAQMASIRNEGGQPLARVSAVVDGPFLMTSGCGEALAPGERCMIAVVFAPKQPGRFAGSLKIAAGDQRAQVPLRGSVPKPIEIVTPPAPVPLPPPQVIVQTPPPPARMLCFEPALVRFTSTGRQTITLTNPESTPLRVIAVLPVGRQGQTVSGYEIDSRRCLRVLRGGEQCRFTVSASELALQTRETMQLTVYYEDPLTGGRRAARFSSACGGR